MGDKFDFEALRVSNLEHALFSKRCYPEEECLAVPAMKVLEQRRMLQQAEDELTSHKSLIQTKMAALAQRRDELDRKTSQLRDSLRKFDKFLKDNEAKRIRARRKAVEERRTREKKEIELVELNTEMDKLESDRTKQSRSLDRNLRYQQYLEDILDHSNSSFTELRDIIARHDTLSAAQQELMARAGNVQESTDQTRKALDKTMEDGNNRILNYNNDIARLQLRLESLQKQTAQAQQEYDRTVALQTQKSLETSQIRQASNNLFSLVKAHLGPRVINTSDAILQLDRIQVFMQDLAAVIAQIQHEDFQKRQHQLQNDDSAGHAAVGDAAPATSAPGAAKGTGALRIAVVPVVALRSTAPSVNGDDNGSVGTSAYSSLHASTFHDEPGQRRAAREVISE